MSRRHTVPLTLLRRLSPAALRDLLEPHAAYLAERDWRLPTSPTDRADYNGLHRILLTAGMDAPSGLVDCFTVIELVGTDEGVEELYALRPALVDAQRAPDETAEDIAARLWRNERNLLTSVFAKISVRKFEKTVHCYRLNPDARLVWPTTELCTVMERTMQPSFNKLVHRDVCNVSSFSDADGFSMLIRHGERRRRFGVLGDNDESETRVLQPEGFDVVFYNAADRELRISGRSAQIQRLYRQTLGEHLCGDIEALQPHRQFTLEPLWRGASSLDHPLPLGLSSVELAAISVFDPTMNNRLQLSGANVFVALDALALRLSPELEISAAQFHLHAAGGGRQLNLKVCAERDTVTGDYQHPLVDEWLRSSPFAHANSSVLAHA